MKDIPVFQSDGAHFHTVIALLVPALVALMNLSASETCRTGTPLKMVNMYTPEQIALRVTKNCPWGVDK